ncbi:hypothetical protein Pcinc_018241 [Petrolisthes cinctipes]|uniref:Uncharacterized protein n=1 Tax=Petrolisthes cinctipes TaxID=88211 RepID=A0AAE1FP50_PETCI|nr:hypothetical protein Pcinc_018241 [Petrolisthes cinctipes]
MNVELSNLTPVETSGQGRLRRSRNSFKLERGGEGRHAPQDTPWPAPALALLGYSVIIQLFPTTRQPSGQRGLFLPLVRPTPPCVPPGEENREGASLPHDGWLSGSPAHHHQEIGSESRPLRQPPPAVLSRQPPSFRRGRCFSGRGEGAGARGRPGSHHDGCIR